MQVLRIGYSLNNRRQNYNTPNIKRNNNVSQPVTFGAKIKLYDELLEELIKLFRGQFNQAAMPQKAENIQMTKAQQLLIFKITLENGCTLAVKKFFPDGNKVKKPYLAVKEFGTSAFKEYIGLDLYTKDLIYIDRSAKPVFHLGEYKRIPLYDENHPFYESKLESYLKQLFPEKTKEIQELNNPQKKPPKTTPKPQEAQQEIPVTPVIDAKTVPLSPPPSAIESTRKAEPTAVTAATPPAQNVTIPTKPQNETLVPEGLSTKPVKRHRIKTSGRVGATLNTNIQENVRTITDIMDKLSKAHNEHLNVSKRAQVSDFKNNYEPIVYTNEKTNRGVTFKFGEGGTLKVVTMERKPLKYLRIIHTDKEGHQKLLLIENGEKVVANTNPNNMSFIPPKTFHATEEELKEIPVAQYTEFLRESLEKYYSELNKVLQSQDPIKLKPATHQAEKSTPQITAQDAKPVPVKDKPVLGPDPEELMAGMKIPEELDKELTQWINEQAAADAQRYVKQYMQSLTEQFSKLLSEKMTEFQGMLSKLTGKN